MTRLSIFILVVMGLAGAALVGGCQRLGLGGPTVSHAPLPALKNIAVLPMDRASIRPGQEKATCALSDTVLDASDVPVQASEQVTHLLFGAIKDDPRFSTVPEGQCVGFLNSMLASDVKASQLRLIQAFGRDLNADAVLYGKLYRFDQRIGGQYGIEKPASVAFTLHLIRVEDGAILWRYTFDETQQPLLENVLKAPIYKKTGMRWLTAEELARYGLDQAIEELQQRLPR